MAARCHGSHSRVCPPRDTKSTMFHGRQKPVEPNSDTHCTDTLSSPMYCVLIPAIPTIVSVILVALFVGKRPVHVIFWFPVPVGLKGPHGTMAYGDSPGAVRIWPTALIGPGNVGLNTMMSKDNSYSRSAAVANVCCTPPKNPFTDLSGGIPVRSRKNLPSVAPFGTGVFSFGPHATF